jgi:hypothetical protein
VTDLLPRGIRLFSCVVAWPWPTAICTAVALAFGSFCYCAGGYLHYKRIAGDERIAAQRAERANLHLQHELDRLRGESINDEERQTASSEQDPASRIAQLTRALEQAQHDLEFANAERAKLAAGQTAPAGSAFAEIERVLASAGIDVKHRLAQFTVTPGTGGPFTPAPTGQHGATPMNLEKLAALRMLVKELPVSAPLEAYKLSSSFGERIDPINGHSSRGVIGVKTHHQSFSASYRAADPVRSKKDERGTPLAWSGVPPPASASEDAKERGPQLPPSLAHPEPRPNSAVRAVINFGLAHPATRI